MMHSVRAAALFLSLCCAFRAASQPVEIGLPFPLTNTRYGAQSGTPLLTANGQKLELVTSSDDGLFVVWSEESAAQTTYRAGVRTDVGDWKEIALPDGAKPLAAAAGGGQFIIVVPRGPSIPAWYPGGGDYYGEFGVLRWTSALEPIGPEIPIHDVFYTDLMVAGWTGSGFAIFGKYFQHTGRLAAIVISTAGTITAQRPMVNQWTFNLHALAFASGGDTMIIAWKATVPNCLGGYCDDNHFHQVRAVRLRSDLTLIDSAADPIEIVSYSRHVESLGGIAWDGNAFVVAWKDGTGMFTRRIPRQGAMEQDVNLDTTGPQAVSAASMSEGNAVAPIPGGVAVVWRQGDTPRQSLVHGGAPTSIAAPETAFRVASVGSSIAYVASVAQDTPPYYGASRIMTTVGDVALPPLPDAPRLNATLSADGRAVLTWSAPPQETNGYRVETRGPSGAWIEVEQWISASEARLLSIRVASPASFRVRAWNDAGVSAYSNEATPGPGKRRSAR
jgi:hypothetical protein